MNNFQLFVIGMDPDFIQDFWVYIENMDGTPETATKEEIEKFFEQFKAE